MHEDKRGKSNDIRILMVNSNIYIFFSFLLTFLSRPWAVSHLFALPNVNKNNGNWRRNKKKKGQRHNVVVSATLQC